MWPWQPAGCFAAFLALGLKDTPPHPALVLFLFCFVLLCIPGCPGALCEAQAGPVLSVKPRMTAGEHLTEESRLAVFSGATCLNVT